MEGEDVSETETEVPAETDEPEADPVTEPETEEDVPFEDPDDPEGAAAPEEAPAAPPADETDPRIIDSQKKWGNFEKAVRAIWGDYADNLMECPVCFTSHKGLIDLNDRGQYPEEVLSAVTEYMRGAAQIEYRQDPQTRTCSTCNGSGKTLTGSGVESHKLRTCPECKGYGYVPPPIPGQTGYNTASGVSGGGIGLAQENGAGVTFDPVSGEVLTPGAEEPEPPADADIWGSPRLLPDGQENPNYGKMPQYKVPTLP